MELVKTMPECLLIELILTFTNIYIAYLCYKLQQEGPSLKTLQLEACSPFLTTFQPETEVATTQLQASHPF